MSIARASIPPITIEQWLRDYADVDDAFELVAGVPTVAPPESFDNIDAGQRLLDILRGTLPSTYVVRPHVGVRLASVAARSTIRVPDLTVMVRESPGHRAYAVPSEILLVAEVVSPSSIERDWVTKRAEYAAAGIPTYVIADVRDADSPRVHVFDRLIIAGGRHGYADPEGDGTSITVTLAGATVTIRAADLLD